MSRPPYGVGPQGESQGSPYAEPTRSPYAQGPQSPYAYPSASPYAYPSSPYAEPAASPYAEPALSPYAQAPQSPYAHPGASPYAEPMRKPDYLRPRQRVQIPAQPPPRRWPWMLTAAVSLVVIAIAVAVMFKNLNDPGSVKAKAGQTKPSVAVAPPASSPQPSPTSQEPDDDQETPSESPEDEPPTDDTVEITPETTAAKAKPKATTTANDELDEDEARIPKVRGRNAQDVQDQLRDLGFTNIQLVPDDPASGLVLFAAGWKAVSVDPSPGEIADLGDAVTVRCVPLAN
ncbi:hypothetical protein [Segniliparus rugosus]|uniref:PASTA domain-containing protein n=1 Tax=Segniliparus rugosus (strain ATCC BAA-974 / DSM 45345 / CCUG 50838 / CIP 108380 / JCM 13579 / CDC 945) TaxID=679197 RepID=E5XV34_SEGRC|nr:hypothetical protein [Segniliparus rugosus]EFV11870.1 hypothetical protein HMPREF9336_03356 [Segniliparus rugosus ATCC BAA-974]